MTSPITISKPIIKNQELIAVNSVMRSGKLVQGAKVLELEEEFRLLCGTQYAVATNNGTSALHTALHAIGLKPGDEVITTPFTFVASVNAIIMAGAKPIFIDIDEKTYNLDPKKIQDAVTPRTKAILVVNLYGQPADYGAINEIAKKNGLIVVEDAAQSVNATYHDKKSGNLADIACFSLYATKNIMSGEGGMITTNNISFYERAHLFRQHGQDEGKKYEYFGLGYNYRMMDLQAAIALVQLKRLESLTAKRQNNARILSMGLEKVPGLILPQTASSREHVYHQFTIRLTPEFVSTRDSFIEYLKKKDVHVAVYYPTPLHLVPHISQYGYKKGDFPISELVSKQVLSLPIHPQLSRSDIDYVISCIRAFAK